MLVNVVKGSSTITAVQTGMIVTIDENSSLVALLKAAERGTRRAETQSFIGPAALIRASF
jgi:hypothetical protein